VLLAEIYSSWIPPEKILTTSLWSSELSKLAANAMLAQRISSINALSAICEATGADIEEVARACGTDQRIGPLFLKASVGFGGSCFRKDVSNLVYLAESLHLYEVADYWRQVITLNDYQTKRFADRVVKTLFNSLTGKKIALWGFAFKKNTGDTRESAAIKLVKSFLAENGQVDIYDPKVDEAQIWHELVTPEANLEIRNPPSRWWLTEVKTRVKVVKSPYEAAVDAAAVVIATEWDEFKCDQMDYRKVYENMHKPAYLFDGRLIIDYHHLKEIGFKVEVIGKGAGRKREMFE
jgi:UDPglucose 6-dehydrogenase